MEQKNKAFTLAELLIALGIVGAIAALTIPSLMSSINNKVLASQLKNVTAAIQQAVDDQMVYYKTRNLWDTDFGSSTAWMSSFSHTKTCSTSTTIATDCWRVAGDDPITYKYITKSSSSTTESTPPPPPPIGVNNPSVVLQNGAVVSFFVYATGVGTFCVDVNGPDSPNIVGRDYFCMNVTKNGKIYGSGSSDSLETKITKCKAIGSGGTNCFDVIRESGWTMPY